MPFTSGTYTGLSNSFNDAVSGTIIDPLDWNDLFTDIEAGINAVAGGIGTFAKTDVASATTCNIGAATTPVVRITGTTTITSLGTVANARKYAYFAAALTLTHNATTLILPGAENIKTAAGDTAEFISDSSGNWRCFVYYKARGADFTNVKDYGAVGDGSTDDATALTAAVASSHKQLYAMDGTFYTTSAFSTITKPLLGTGKIHTSGGDWLPGTFSFISALPTSSHDLTHSGTPDIMFSGDTSHVFPEYFILGDVRTSRTASYFNSTTTPHPSYFDNRSGSSGYICKLTSDASIGQTTISVNSTSGITDGQMYAFDNQNASSAMTDPFTVVSHTSNTITFTPALANNYLASTTSLAITNGKRTQNPFIYSGISHKGGGDCYYATVAASCEYTPLAGQTHFGQTATLGIFGGQVTASHDGVYLQASEVEIEDNGNDIAVVGDVRNYYRTNNTGARQAVWIGNLQSSIGSLASNAAYSVNGSWNVGLDTTNGVFTSFSNCAIGLAQNHRIYFDNAADSSQTPPLWGSTIGSTYVRYSSGSSVWELVVKGVQALQANGSGSVFVGASLTASTVFAAAHSISGATSGSVTLRAPSVAGSNTVTLPAGTTDFSATGGTNQVVQQSTSGGAFTVGQLSAASLANGVTGTGNIVLQTAPTINGGTHTALTSLGIRSTGSGAFDLTFANTENLTGAKTLTFRVNDVSRTIDISGNIQLAGSLITSGANSLTLTTSGATNVTLPTSGTLVNSAVTTLSSLTSIGTIGTGTWQGSIVTGTYGGTGVNNGSNTITLGGNLTTSGAFATTLTVTGATNVTLPTSGTLVTSAVTTLSSLTSIGTIGTGVWQGTAVGSAYGGTGQNFSASSGIVKFTAGTASVVAAPTGAIVGTTDTQTFFNKTFGDGTTIVNLDVNGANSGTNGGAQIVVKNGGTVVAAIGNYSTVIGSAYDATPTIYFAANAKLWNGGVAVNFNASATASSSTSTGTVVVTGGVGVSGAGYFGGDFSSAGKSAFGTAAPSSTTYVNLPAGTTGVSPLRWIQGAAPSAPVDGDMWREDNTNTGLKIRVNGVTKTVTLS